MLHYIYWEVLSYSYHRSLAHNNKNLVNLKRTSLLLRRMILNFSFSANFPPYHKKRYKIFDTLTLLVYSTSNHITYSVRFTKQRIIFPGTITISAYTFFDPLSCTDNFCKYVCHDGRIPFSPSYCLHSYTLLKGNIIWAARALNRLS